MEFSALCAVIKKSSMAVIVSNVIKLKSRKTTLHVYNLWKYTVNLGILHIILVFTGTWSNPSSDRQSFWTMMKILYFTESWLMPTSLRANELLCNSAILIRATEKINMSKAGKYVLGLWQHWWKWRYFPSSINLVGNQHGSPISIERQHAELMVINI